MALSGVDLEVRKGEVVALLGRNGAGKTTFFSILAGLLRPDAGSISVDGRDMSSHPAYVRRSVGLTSQEPAVYPNLSVRDNLRIFGELGGLRRTALQNHIRRVAEMLQLSDVVNRRARELSGGEVRRLHIAMTLMPSPGVLLLDEPTAGMDIDSRAGVFEVVRGLVDDGAAICYATHHFAEVERLEASVAILSNGRIAVRGSLERLVREHGRCAIDLLFSGEPPKLAGRRDVQVAGERMRVYIRGEYAAETALVLIELGTAAERVRSIELIRPNLEAVFLEITGGRRDEGSNT